MPYKDPGKQREATRERVRRYRNKNVTPSINVTPPDTKANVTPKTHVTPDVIPRLPLEWQQVTDYISRTTTNLPLGHMPNLERLQRIAGSLGKYSSEVFFGIPIGVTLKQIGDVIGTKPPAHPR